MIAATPFPEDPLLNDWPAHLELPSVIDSSEFCDKEGPEGGPSGEAGDD